MEGKSEFHIKNYFQIGPFNKNMLLLTSLPKSEKLPGNLKTIDFPQRELGKIRAYKLPFQVIVLLCTISTCGSHFPASMQNSGHDHKFAHYFPPSLNSSVRPSYCVLTLLPYN